MTKYKILIDSCCDLPREFVEKNNIPFLGLTCTFKDETYKDDFGKSLDYKTFYDQVRNGETPTTAQINSYIFAEEFRKFVSEGYAIIYLSFSSALSGTYSNAVLAREDVLSEYKTADITIIDSRSASLGEGLLAYYAYEMMNSGASKDEVVEWLEDNKLKVIHWFTVNDLNHLKRGGRISATSAAIGTILDIKPILHVDNEGRLIPVTKVKGRKKSIKTLAEKLKDTIVNPEEQIIAISHGDCYDEAKLLEELILEVVSVKGVIINNVGPVIGSHAGPGTLALFFMGKDREV